VNLSRVMHGDVRHCSPWERRIPNAEGVSNRATRHDGTRAERRDHDVLGQILEPNLADVVSLGGLLGSREQI
jgi:hypothetical protein